MKTRILQELGSIRSYLLFRLCREALVPEYIYIIYIYDFSQSGIYIYTYIYGPGPRSGTPPDGMVPQAGYPPDGGPYEGTLGSM